MNETALAASDLLLLAVAVAVAFVLGAAQRIGRAAARERRAVDLSGHDIQDLSERCERQQASVSRLSQELSDVRQALLQQALALAPVHAAMHGPGPGAATTPAREQTVPAAARPGSVAAPPPAPAASRPPAPVAPPAPAASRPPARKPLPGGSAPKPGAADPLALARAGAGIEVLMARAGLSRAEAELVRSVHGPRRAGAA